MLAACDERYGHLIADGVSEDVALDRIWDCYETVWLGLERHCFDKRDRLFENRLRTIREKGTTNA